MEYAAIAIVFLGMLGLMFWLTWLYLLLYKRCRSLELDNYRLMRRLGSYHNVAITDPSGAGDTHVPLPPSDSPIPPFFRMKKPVPPPGWKPGPGEEIR